MDINSFLNNDNLNDVLKLVNCSLRQLYKRDKHLFYQVDGEVKDTCERSMVFRFGIYFNERLKKNYPDLFPRKTDEKLSVDIEYNRNMGEVKNLLPTDVHGYFPDLIVHKRESNEFNEIIMEFKKAPCNPSDLKNDEDKIMSFCNNEPYFFKLGIFVLLSPDNWMFEYYWNKKWINYK